MKRMLYTCDRCRKEITGDPVNICMEVIDRENSDYLSDAPYPDIAELDFCRDCGDFIADRIRHFCKKGATAIINEDFESAVEEMIATSQPDPPPTDKPKRRLDTGKVAALRKAGWTVKAIAEEMSCSEQTVYNALNKMKAPEPKPTEQSPTN